MIERKADASLDPGVPEALPRCLSWLREQVGVPAIDRLWIFPPSRRGRREVGLIAVSTFQGHGGRRGVVTVTYTAEQTGKGTTVEPVITREGEAPPDRFPALIRGVVTRGGEERGEPREVEVEASGESFAKLMEEFRGVWADPPTGAAEEATLP
jgi:hypothetical protein